MEQRTACSGRRVKEDGASFAFSFLRHALERPLKPFGREEQPFGK